MDQLMSILVDENTRLVDESYSVAIAVKSDAYVSAERFDEPTPKAMSFPPRMAESTVVSGE
jgi:hypothetical protein